MAVRREQVILDLEDNLTPGLARAAVAAGLLDRELKGLGGSSTSTSRNLDRTATSTDKVGQSSRKATPEVDHLAGRMRIFADAAITLGPALIPLGAATIPVLTAALAGLTAAAGGIGVAVLAIHGLGDGIKALDAYQLKPTAENLSKLRLEMEKLGPAGADFVRFLDDLEPKLSNLQKIARAGLFPGAEDGITALLTRLPQVRRIVFDLATGMGDLARQAGEGLASDKFTAFFDYIETDARPTLEAFARSAGNVAEGFANLLVAFAPLSRDFTGGLEGATKAFARWSRGLDENKSFQDFLQYVRESGPQAVALLGALASALAGIVQAAAPFGQVVLPALTAIAKVFGAIAKTPIGPPLFTAAAGLIAFNRAASISGKLSDSLTRSFANLGLEAETTKGKLTNIGLAGAAAALALGTVSDAQEILASRSRSNDTLDATVKSLQDLEDTVAGSNLSKYAQDLHIDLPRLTDDLARNGAQGEYVQKVQKQLADSSHGVGAAFNALAGNILPFYTASADKAYGANKDLKSIIDALGNGLGKTPGLFGGVIDAIKRAKDAAHDLSGALADLNGWFDKREAIRNYRQSIEDLRKSLKNGFGPKDVENLDNLGRGILQVANSIKDPGLQRDFLQGARASLEELANHAGPKAAAAIQRLIDKFDDEHLTHPPKIKPDVDDGPARHKIDGVKGLMMDLDGTRANPKISADAGQAFGTINQVTTMLRNLNGTTATTYVRTVRSDIPLPGRSADGGTVPKTGMAYADRWHYMLADGEEVISNRHGQADRHRALLKAINAGRLADGGTTGGRHQTYTSSLPGATSDATHAIQIWTDGVYTAAKALKALNAELAAQKKAIDKAKQARDDALSRRDSISQTIQQGLMGDSIWSASTGSVWSAGAHGANDPASAIAALNARKDRAQRLVTAIATLKGKGVTGPALLEILNEGLEAAEAMAAADVGTLSTFSTAVNDSTSALAAAGLAGGNAIEGDNVHSTQKRLDRLHDDLHEIKLAIKDANEDNKTAQDKNAKDVKDGVNGAASSGHRRGKH